LINDPELRPEDTLKNLISKIFRKADKPLHIRDLENIVVSKGHFQAHNRKIPLKPSRSLTPILRESYGICKLSKGIYGLSEWQNVDSEVGSSEETDVAVQATLQDASSLNNSMEESNIIKKNCPECDGEIDIKRHFCKYCGANLFKFCNNCLGKIDDDSIFCVDCGIKLEQRI
ncbi:MAG: zinc ribbon domain-containing protein, partial [Methanosarcina sp.]